MELVSLAPQLVSWSQGTLSTAATINQFLVPSSSTLFHKLSLSSHGLVSVHWAKQTSWSQLLLNKAWGSWLCHYHILDSTHFSVISYQVYNNNNNNSWAQWAMSCQPSAGLMSTCQHSSRPQLLLQISSYSNSSSCWSNTGPIHWLNIHMIKWQTCSKFRKFLNIVLVSFTSSVSRRASRSSLADFPPAPSSTMARAALTLTGEMSIFPCSLLATDCKQVHSIILISIC